MAHLRQLIHAPAVKEGGLTDAAFFSQRFQNYVDELAPLGDDVSSTTELVREMSGERKH